jgi:hypothetical protein
MLTLSRAISFFYAIEVEVVWTKKKGAQKEGKGEGRKWRVDQVNHLKKETK